MKRTMFPTFFLPVLALTSLLLVTVSAERPNKQPPAPSLAIEIPMTGGPFTIPAAGAGRYVFAHVRVPSLDGVKSPHEQVTAIRLVPSMTGDKVEVRVYALYGDTSSVKSCDDWKALKSSLVATYVAGDGEELAVNELSKMGVSFGERPLLVKIVPSKFAAATAALQDTTACHCGSCGELSCCPEKGYCLGCGPCGQVCCGIKPSDENQ